MVTPVRILYCRVVFENSLAEDPNSIYKQSYQIAESKKFAVFIRRKDLNPLYHSFKKRLGEEEAKKRILKLQDVFSIIESEPNLNYFDFVLHNQESIKGFIRYVKIVCFLNAISIERSINTLHEKANRTSEFLKDHVSLLNRRFSEFRRIAKSRRGLPKEASKSLEEFKEANSTSAEHWLWSLFLGTLLFGLLEELGRAEDEDNSFVSSFVPKDKSSLLNTLRPFRQDVLKISDLLSIDNRLFSALTIDEIQMQFSPDKFSSERESIPQQFTFKRLFLLESNWNEQITAALYRQTDTTNTKYSISTNQTLPQIVEESQDSPNPLFFQMLEEGSTSSMNIEASLSGVSTDDFSASSGPEQQINQPISEEASLQEKRNNSNKSDDSNRIDNSEALGINHRNDDRRPDSPVKNGFESQEEIKEPGHNENLEIQKRSHNFKSSLREIPTPASSVNKISKAFHAKNDLVIQPFPLSEPLKDKTQVYAPSHEEKAGNRDSTLVIDLSGGKNIREIGIDDGLVVFKNFGEVGSGTRPSRSKIDEADTLIFKGKQFTASNLLLSQTPNGVQITFEGVESLRILLLEESLSEIDNLSMNTGSSIDLANLLFSEQGVIDNDILDVLEEGNTPTKTYRPGITSILNDASNNIQGHADADDTINAQGGNDYVEGRSGDDVLRGGDGNDTLLGQHGDDRLVGGSGNDVLHGGAGKDYLDGGAGRDIFILSPEEGSDIIAHFEPEKDSFQLTGGLNPEDIDIQSRGNSSPEKKEVIIINKKTGGILAELHGVNIQDLTSKNLFDL